MVEKLRKGCVTTIYYAKFFIARACIRAGSGFLLFISNFLTLHHLYEASHNWVYGDHISFGMHLEIEEADKLDIPVRRVQEQENGFAIGKIRPIMRTEAPAMSMGMS